MNKLIIRDFILIFLFIAVLYLLNKTNCTNLEHMSISDNINTIKNLIREVYQADIEAIRNLSEFAQEIKNSNTQEIVIPANVTITGKLTLNNDLQINKNNNK